MKGKLALPCIVVIISLAFLSLAVFVFADKAPPDPGMLKLDSAKMAPVPFSHSVHVEKAKIDCVKCHHKEKNPKEPQKCVTCHPLKEAKENVTPAKEAYHKLCIACHKEVAEKGKNVPVKCNECHKK